MHPFLKELLQKYPDYTDFIKDAWGDEDYYGDKKTAEEMYYNIEIAVQRMISKGEVWK